jgi:hypothetical protein
VGVKGQVYEIDNATTGNITINTTGVETINNELEQIIPFDNNIKVQSNGIAWRIK